MKLIRFFIIFLLLFLFSTTPVIGKEKGRPGPDKATGVKRDKNGKIDRDSKEKEKFMQQTGYPHGRPGYIVDHIIPLKKGGTDTPSNMQWQTKQEAKKKDKTE